MPAGPVFSEDQSLGWWGPVLLAMAVVLVAFTLAGWANGTALVTRGSMATGTVMAKDVTSEGGRSLRYEFTTPDGARYRNAYSVAQAAFDAAAVGGPVTVTYLAEDPTVSVIAPAASPSVPILWVAIAFEGLFVVIGAWATLRALANWTERRA